MVIPVASASNNSNKAAPAGLDLSKRRRFFQKENKVNTYFMIGGIAVGLIIVVLILLAMHQAGASHQ